MAESLFKEADEIGIFQETGQGVDYLAALSKIEKIVKDNQGQIDSSSGQTKKVATAEGTEDNNDELYD